MGASVQVVKQMAARPAKVYAAWTQPDLLAKWWGPKAEAEVDLRVGGRFRLAMTFGSEPMAAVGTYLEILPQQRLVFTFNWEGSPAEEETRVTVEFRPVAGGTEVVVTHDGFATQPLAENHKQGWNDCEDRLVALAPALEREIRFETYIAAPPRKVWRAVESQEMIRRWLGGRTEFEPGLGGRVRVYDNTGEWQMGGPIVEWEVGVRMTFLWEGFVPTTHAPTHFTLELIPEGDGTRVVLRHHRFESVSEEEYLGYKQGWGDGQRQLAAIAAIALAAA